MSETLDPDALDVSLRDLEPPPSPESLRHSVEPSEAATTTDGEEEEEELLDVYDDKDLPDSEIGSAGGFSPPAWRRHVPPSPHHQRRAAAQGLLHHGGLPGAGLWRGPVDALGTLPFTKENTPESRYDSDNGVLEKAIRTRLPRGSESPVKGRSVSPERPEDVTLRWRASTPLVAVAAGTAEQPSENCKFHRWEGGGLRRNGCTTDDCTDRWADVVSYQIYDSPCAQRSSRGRSRSRQPSAPPASTSTQQQQHGPRPSSPSSSPS